MRGDNEFVVGANYQMPLFYPDWGFAGLIYLQRIRLNLFTDISQVTNNSLNMTYDQNSYGFELIVDATVVNQLRLSFGLRNSVLLDRDYFDEDKKNAFQFFFAGTF